MSIIKRWLWILVTGVVLVFSSQARAHAASPIPIYPSDYADPLSEVMKAIDGDWTTAASLTRFVQFKFSGEPQVIQSFEIRSDTDVRVKYTNAGGTPYEEVFGPGQRLVNVYWQNVNNIYIGLPSGPADVFEFAIYSEKLPAYHEPYRELTKVERVVAKVEPGQVVLTWNPIPGADGYRIWRNGGPVVTVREPRLLDNTVAPLSDYEYRIAAYSGRQYSEGSDVVSVSTLPLPLPAVRDLQGTVYADRVHLKWQPVAAAAHYQVYRVEDGSAQKVGTTSVPEFTVAEKVQVAEYAVGAFDAHGQQSKLTHLRVARNYFGGTPSLAGMGSTVKIVLDLLIVFALVAATMLLAVRLLDGLALVWRRR